MDDASDRIETALGAMALGGPRALRAYLEQPGPDFKKATPREVDQLVDLLLAADPNTPERLRFSSVLRSWDNAKNARWTGDTPRNSASRRKRIHELLRSDPSLAERIDAVLPYFSLEEPLIIAETHVEWYVPQPGIQDYYWRTYLRYLRDRRGWGEQALLNLDNSTRAIVECLANPEAPEAYASRGLAVGYVQSGKTANFAGVVARAADAGYRLIVVLAGTWNILRNQTQRRFDKELLGKELLANDDAYSERPPPDWDDFLEHGTDPATLGEFTWQRLTRPDIDFKRLKAAIDNLDFEKINKAAPLFAPDNLRRLPVKLLVVKKNKTILTNLVRDLELTRNKLAELPALFIDDESDQAGINTIDPAKRAAGRIDRSKTNEAIVKLLRLFPRGQYVGYTATPYANALVDPDDPEDLFPKDFIVSLDRPQGYMGVSDFFDPEVAYEDLEKDDYSQSEIAYIRRVETPVGNDDEDLKRAIRSYVLSGGIKLFRHEADPARYRPEHFRHHTMLVHTSQLKGEHASLADRLERLWAQCALNSPQGLSDLESLWETDYRKVCAAQGSEVIPGTFEELVPHLSQAITRVQAGPRIFLVVNSDNLEAPDFSASPVWKVVVGGNKLSRGYTIEGLTVSYYRRVAGTADTLMQMGRWFGFRPGYQDLVRVFVGVKEGRSADADLVLLFKEVCRMEERFRSELKRYVRRPEAPRITPKQIPPLISASGNLPPTAKNKMFNAILKDKNFGGQRSMLTLAPVGSDSKAANAAALETLLRASESLGTLVLGGRSSEGAEIQASCVAFASTNEGIVAFLSAYHWLETSFKYPSRPRDADLQIDFLQNAQHEIESWLILAPQRKNSFGDPMKLEGICDLTVKERHRADGRGFQVFGEPIHRTIAEYLGLIKPGVTSLAPPNTATEVLQAPHRGIFLLYPVREAREDSLSIGFELLFPENRLSYDLNLTVRSQAAKGVVVAASGTRR